MTETGRKHYGTVVEVGDSTESHEEHGNIVPIRIRPDEQIKNARPGATATVKVNCGKAPMGWAFLHEAWEWLEANAFF